MFQIDDREIKALEADLQHFAGRALPFATKNTVNGAAFAGQKAARQNIRDEFINRNKWSEQSVRVAPTRTLDINRQMALVGSTLDYMEDQEFGATKTSRGTEGVSIPTSYSAGQAMGSKPRTRLPRKPNKLRNIQLRRRGANMTNAGRVKAAAASGHKYVFLDMGRRKGIFRVLGSKKRPKVRMVHDLSRTSVRIPRSPWLQPAVNTAAKELPRLYRESLLFQLKRQKILGYR